MIARSYTRYGPYKYYFTLFFKNGVYIINFDGKNNCHAQTRDIHKVEKLAARTWTAFLDAKKREPIVPIADRPQVKRYK